MKYLSLIEHERVWLATDGQSTGLGAEGRQYIEERHYGRLQRFDERQSKNEEGRQIFSFHSKWIKARNWVGVVQIRGLCVEVLPKIAPRREIHDEAGARAFIDVCRKNLLYMLSVGREPLFRERDLASLDVRVSPLSEKLIEIFASRLQEQLLVGLPRSYTHREENLRRLKGKLKFAEHLAVNMADRSRFYVQYDEFVPDNTMNRVFKACCRILLRNTVRPRTQEKLRHCLLLLDDVADVHVTLDDFKRVPLTRQNARLHEVFNFCMLIVSQQSPTAGAGKTHTFTLLFDMNAVFEEFVTAFYLKKVLPQLSSHLPADDFQLHPQGKGTLRRYLLSYHDASSHHVMLKPDLLFTHSRDRSAGSHIVMDTKWKAIPVSRGRPKVNRADYYQMFAYAHRYAATLNVLLYPRSWEVADGECRHEFRFLQSVNDQSGDRMLVCFVDLNTDLRIDWQHLAGELAAILRFASGPMEVAG